MKRSVNVFRMHMHDKFSWLFLPWIILGSSFGVNLLVATSTQDAFVTGGLASIFFYYFVVGIIAPAQTFPFALGMGVRRMDYFLGTSLTVLLTSLLSTALILALSALENSWLYAWGVGLNFFHIPFVSEGSYLMQAATFLALFVFMFFGGFVIGCIYRRFGRTGMYTLIVLGILLMFFTPMLISYYDRWDEMGRWVEAHIRSLNDLTPWLLPPAALLALASFGLLRRTTV